MPIAAFTNRVGYYERSEFVQQLVKGHYGGTVFDDVIYHTVGVESSSKSATVKSDGIRSTPYFRQVTKVLADRPKRQRTITYYNGKVYTDIVDTVPISLSFPTLHLSLPNAFLEDFENAKSMARTKLRSKLADDGSVSNGADIAEGRETVSMIAKTVVQIYSAFKAGKAGNWDEVPKILQCTKADLIGLKSLAEKWLAYQYGWKPLMGSIHDNYNLFQRQKQEPQQLDIRTGSPEVKFSSRQELNGYDTLWECTGRAFGGIKATIDNPYLRSVDTLGLLNPFSVAWEVVPFSFFFDWFIPIGSMLSSLSATAGLSFNDGYLSSSHTCIFTARAKGDYLDHGELRIAHFTFQREVFNSFPLPEIYGKSNPFSTTHTLNALALMRTNFI